MILGHIQGIHQTLSLTLRSLSQDDTENLPFPNEKSDFRLPDEYLAAKKLKQGNSPESIKSESDIKSETKLKKDMNKESGKKEGVKEVSKESKKDMKDSIKEFRKSLGSKDLKEKKENKDIKEMKRELKKEVKDLAKELKKDLEDNQEVKTPKHKESAKEKRFKKEESDKDTSPISSPSLSKKDRLKELLGETKLDDSPKRGGKRSTRGSIKSDDASSTKSSSPISATPPPFKRRRL
uniref:Choline kinase N-terminal domain-containing protein n=1 Tax=Timema bartmani TaxID=61472 RepID=A0A7R9EZ69_9NEOP|nr:unnamed protein product [Timema bartmani]